MGEAREARQAGGDLGRSDANGAGRGVGRGGVLPVMDAGQAGHAADIGGFCRLGLGVVVEHAAHDVNPAGYPVVAGDRDGLAVARGLEFGVDRPAVIVVDADHRRRALSLAGEDPAFGGGVAFHTAMAVQVVGADVEQYGDIEGDGVHQLELVGRQLQHVGAVAPEGLQRQRRGAEVAADRHRAAGAPENVADQRHGGRFAVGAGHPDVACIALGAGEQLDVRDDLGPGRARALDHGMRLGMGVRDPRREHQRAEACPVAAMEINERHAVGGGRPAALLVVVPRPHLGAARRQRLGCAHAGFAKAHDGDGMAREEGHGDHSFTSA